MNKKNNLLICALIFMSWLIGPSARALEFIEKSAVGVSDDANPLVARKKIQEQVQVKVAEDIIRDLLGFEKFQKNQKNIQDKILKQTSRFIPVSKNGDLKKEGNSFMMPVSVRVSLKDLQILLEENGLLALSDTQPIVLPLISILDDVRSEAYFWWNPFANNFLQSLSINFESSVQEAFWKNGFFILQPQKHNWQLALPYAFKKNKLSLEEIRTFADSYKAPFVISGPIVIRQVEGKKFSIEMNFKIIQVNNLRTIADVVRKFTTDSGAYEVVVPKKIKEVKDPVLQDLALQMLEVWQRGSLGTSSMQLSFQGFFSPLQVENLKQSLQSQVSGLRNVKERLISTKTVTFDVDTVSSRQELAQKLATATVLGKNWRLVEETDRGLIFR